MRTVVAAAAIALILLLWLTGCTSCSTKQDPEQLREKTAQTTANLKQDATAIAQGIREGWSRDHPLNVNTASAQQLTSLPGITPRAAERIVANRPYANPGELVSKGVVSKTEYDRIADKITVKK